MTAPGDPDVLLSADAALAAILATIPGPTDPEWVHLSDALGRVSAEDVRASIDLPPWDNSAMDGFAVRSADIASASDDAPVRLEVLGDVAAGGRTVTKVRRGTAIRIATGGRLPAGADAVVPVERTTPEAGSVVAGAGRGSGASALPAIVLVREAVAAGGSVRRRASDLMAGSTVLARGTPVTPAGVAIVAGSGHAGLLVRRRPIVGILATGDEIRTPGADLGEAGIPDANGPAIRALVEDAGADGRNLGIAGDRIEDLRARLAAGLAEQPDAIIVSGGVSVGPFDHVRTAFGEIGEIDLWRVAVQPGKPFAFGTAPRLGGSGRVLLFGLPGNPVSTFVTFELFVRPALRTLAGALRPTRPVDRAVLLDETRKSSGRRAFVRVVAERNAQGAPARDEQGRVRVTLAGGPAGQGSHVLSALAAADALAVIPEIADVHPAGGEVELWWLDRG